MASASFTFTIKYILFNISWSGLKLTELSSGSITWLPAFINFTKMSGVPLDFVSSHLYPRAGVVYLPQVDPFNNWEKQWSTAAPIPQQHLLVSPRGGLVACRSKRPLEKP